MTTPCSGAISIANLNAEFGAGNDLNSYHGRGGAPASGPISLANLYCKSNYVPGSGAWGAPGTYYAVVQSNVFYATIIAGGGNGLNAGGSGPGGGGGSGGWYHSYGISVTPGATVTIVVGGISGDTVIYTSDSGERLRATGGQTAQSGAGGWAGGYPNGQAGQAGDWQYLIDGRGGNGGTCTCPSDGVIVGGAGGAGGASIGSVEAGFTGYPGNPGGYYGSGGGGGATGKLGGAGRHGAAHIWW